MIRWKRFLDRIAERWDRDGPTVRAEWDGEAVSVEWNRRACLETAVRLLVRVLRRHHRAEISRLSLAYRFVEGRMALPECPADDFARGLAEFLIIPSLDVLVLELPEVGASHVTTTEGSAACGWLTVDLPGFDPEVLRAAVAELRPEVPERLIGPA